jgi:hypothetical protein
MNLLNKETLTMFVLAIVAVVVFVWVVLPHINNLISRMRGEHFSEEAPISQETDAGSEESEEARVPNVDPATGMMMDGPGFERGEVEGAPEAPTTIPANYYFIDDGAGGEMSIQHNLCSKSCCSEQWPTPFKQKYDPYVCNNKSDFVPSQIMCNNSFQDSGCLCLSKKQNQFLYNRGGNGREWF